MKKNYDYKPFSEWKWRNYDGDKDVTIEQFIKENSDCLFFIGTDSQNYTKGRKCLFTSVLIAYRMGRGGSVIMCRDKTPFMDGLRQRLLSEAMRSLEVAWYVNGLIPVNKAITIHLDVNKNLQYKSSKYRDELVGLIISQGYSCITKPDAWGASKVADLKC